jgi:ATP-dependent helicase HrpA
MRHEAAGITTDAFPPALAHRGRSFKLGYHHDPGAADDGVTLDLPLAALNQLPANRCEWLVPGLLKEKVLALLKTLQQKYRHRLQPLDEFASNFCDMEHDLDEPLVRALTRAAEEHLAMKLPLDAFRTGELRPHLFMNFRLTDEHGGTLAISRNLAELRADYRDRVEQAYAEAEVTTRRRRRSVRNHGMELRCAAGTDGSERRRRHYNGFSGAGRHGRERAPDRLRYRGESARRTSPRHGAPVRAATGGPGQGRREAAGPARTGAAIHGAGYREGTQGTTGGRDAGAHLPDGPAAGRRAAFATRREAARGRILLVAQEILRLLVTVLAEHSVLAKKLAGMQKAFPQAAADIGTQLAELMPKRFIVLTPFERLQHYPRYLKAISLRLDKARSDPARDARLMADWQALGKPWERERNAMLKSGQAGDAFLDEFRWLLEELRVALFAQELKTSSPVSVKRLQKMWDGRLHR